MSGKNRRPTASSLAIVCVLTAGTIGACSSHRDPAPATEAATARSADFRQTFQETGKIRFDTEIFEDGEISGIAVAGDLLFLGVDEGTVLQILRRTAENRYRELQRIDLDPQIDLDPDDRTETDIEGISIDNGLVYVVGSHSFKRKKPKDNKSRLKNRDRLKTIEGETTRDKLYRFELSDVEDEDREVDSLSLRGEIKGDPYLGPFSKLPSKENGVDIEGIAVVDGRVFCGFRGPVLRGGHTPVMAFDFPDEGDYELLFVLLDGLGVRDMAAVSDGFLIVAGPVGDRPGPYVLYHWDGNDCVRDEEEIPCNVVELGEIPTRRGAKAEGIAVLSESADEYRLVVVYDSAENGDAKLFTVTR